MKKSTVILIAAIGAVVLIAAVLTGVLLNNSVGSDREQSSSFGQQSNTVSMETYDSSAIVSEQENSMKTLFIENREAFEKIRDYCFENADTVEYIKADGTVVLLNGEEKQVDTISETVRGLVSDNLLDSPVMYRTDDDGTEKFSFDITYKPNYTVISIVYSKTDISDSSDCEAIGDGWYITTLWLD